MLNPARALQQPGTPVTTVSPGGAVTVQLPSAPATAAEMYQAASAVREALLDQYSRTREQRAAIAEATRDVKRTPTDITGLESRLKFLDERLLDLEKQIAQSEANVVQTAAVPGAMIEPPKPPRDRSIDWDSALTGGAFLSFALLFPLVIAYSRRVWRRSASVTVTLPPELATRMRSVEEAIESVAVEVERIGEGQRFMTQSMSEQPRFVGAGVAEAALVRAREPLHAERPR